MKTVVLSMSLLLWILCLQQYCFLGTVNAVLELNYGDNCTLPQQCQSQNLTCLDGICQCKSGFYFSLTKGCLSQLNHGDNCTLPQECQSQNLTCLDGICQCESGFYFNSTEGCRSQICTSADDCLSLNSTCINGTCDCTSGFYLNLTMCLPQRDIFESCNATEECLGNNVQCKQNNCTCEDQYYYQNDSCYAKSALFESCNETEECLGDHVECTQNNCSCEDKYYDQNGYCFSKREIFKNCTATRQCLGEHVECTQNRCTCEKKYYYDDGYCHTKYELFESCNDTKQCVGDNVQCKQGNCTCEDQYYYQNDSCYAKKKIHVDCSSILECLDVNAVCLDGICKCDTGYFYKTGVECVQKHKIFNSCTATRECLGEHVECKEKKCTCENLYYDYNGACYLRLIPDSPCHFDRMCKMLSTCKKNKCVCIEEYYFTNYVCFKKLGYGELCDKNGCKDENMYCSYKCKCKDGYEYEDSSCKKKTSKALIIIMVILILILFCVLAYILWKIKGQKSADFKPSTQMELDIPRCRPILMSIFPEAVHVMHQDSDKIFAENFMDLSRINPLILTGNSDLTSTTRYLPCHEATKSANATKNRFLDILPFDQSRVKLKPVDDDATSDYINASYISGYSREKEYIAAQGPLSNTSTDFWRMVWQEKVSIIVMLTLCREKEMNKCDNYWPLEKDNKLDFDDITVETTNVTNYDSYDYRSMILKIDETSRSLKHFHFLHWADFSANVPIEILISFVRNVRSHITSNTPVVIHCSAGVGRTGTFIAVDYLLQFVDANPLDSNIDIFHFVSKMRGNRVHMVQNKNQYILIHDCINHVVKKKIALENGQPDDVDNENHYENEGFVTIDLKDKAKDEKKSQDLGSVLVIIEESEEKNEETEKESEEVVVDLEENPYENEIQVQITEEKEKNEEVSDLEENPYENEIQGLSNAEKDYLNDYEPDENPYDVPENAMLINNDETQSDKSNKDPSEEQQHLVILAGEVVEEENPYENQDFVEADEKQKLTDL